MFDCRWYVCEFLFQLHSIVKDPTTNVKPDFSRAFVSYQRCSTLSSCVRSFFIQVTCWQSDLFLGRFWQVHDGTAVDAWYGAKHDQLVLHLRSDNLIAISATITIECG